MSKGSKQHRVKYVIGDCFGQPVVCEHIIPIDDEVYDNESDIGTPVTSSVAVAGKKSKSKHQGKRTCGHSQRSARDARKAKMASDKK